MKISDFDMNKKTSKKGFLEFPGDDPHPAPLPRVFFGRLESENYIYDDSCV